MSESNENRLLAALGYPIWIVALVVLLTSGRERPFMRYHALQALGWAAAWFAVMMALLVLSMVPLVGWAAGMLGFTLMPLAHLGISIYFAWRTYRGQCFAIPYLTDLLRQQVGMPGQA